MDADARYVPLVAMARRLLASGGTLQSLDGGEVLERAEVQPALVEHLRRIQPAAPEVLQAVASRMLDSLDATLAKASDVDAGPPGDAELDNLEVIVQVLGRPALRLLSDRRIEPFSNAVVNEHWITTFNTIRNQILVREGILASAPSVAKVVLRLNTGRDMLLGTGWRLGDELLVTNRHVVPNLVADRSLAPSQWTFDPARTCVADFNDAEGSCAAARFAVTGLAYCSPEPSMDVAVLRLRPGSVALPPALKVSFDPIRLGTAGAGAAFNGKEVYVVGHPSMSLPTPEITQVFIDADGSKRCAPGFVTALRSDAPWLLHDCSTLRGNSGSAVLGMDHHEVIGIHFGGKATDGLETLGPFNAAVALALLPQHPLRAILSSGTVASA